MHFIISPTQLSEIKAHANCENGSGITLCKAVVDIDRKRMVIGWGFHADEMEMLLDDWSDQSDLWGINLYPSEFWKSEFIEFDSMINLRPNAGNRTRSVDDPKVQERIREIVTLLIHA